MLFGLIGLLCYWCLIGWWFGFDWCVNFWCLVVWLFGLGFGSVCGFGLFCFSWVGLFGTLFVVVGGLFCIVLFTGLFVGLVGCLMFGVCSLFGLGCCWCLVFECLILVGVIIWVFGWVVLFGVGC